MSLKLRWTMAVIYNYHGCRACWTVNQTSKGTIIFARDIYQETGLRQTDQGYFKELRKRIVSHYKDKHPEYEIIALREGPK